MDNIEYYLFEDLDRDGDITSDALFSNEKAKARIISKENCIIAGLEEIKNVFTKTGAQTEFLVKDGDYIKKRTVVAKIYGTARSILKAERLVLNIISRMSAIATETKKLVQLCKSINPYVTVAATRKTTPGFRKYEKMAVEIGGGEQHRFGLYDAVMIKDNHLKIIGSVEKAIKKVKNKVKNKIIEIEVENETDALIAAKLGVNVIMLDNFNSKIAEIVTKKIRKIDPNILIEISGGVTPDNIENYASFADRISMGFLTHSIKSMDFSLEII
jgi:nicotinate-nucleotide pyrophosphorylase (carboxylating)